MANFSGTWKQEKTENLDDFLKTLGVGMIKRKLAVTMNPTVVITQDGNKVTVKTTSKLSSSTAVYDLGGPEFESDTQGLGDGLYTCTAALEGNNLVVRTVPKTTTLKAHVQTRELLNENELLQTLECDGVVCKRYFKRQ